MAEEKETKKKTSAKKSTAKKTAVKSDKPAKAGTGIIAGGSVRAILELAGVKDIISKSLGSNTKLNTARATIDALKSQKSANHIAELRGKSVEEILG